jgi:long-chain acyl-CoA synthetase
MKVPTVPLTINAAIDEAIDRYADREALRSDAGSCTYAELSTKIHRAARVLRSLGVRRGSAVAGSMANREEIIVAFLATMRLGARWVGLNRALALGEKQAVVRDARARILLLEEEDARSWAVLDEDKGPRVVPVGGPGSGWANLNENAPSTRIDVDVDPLALACLAYTSGTTGQPKGVMHSQYGLVLPALWLASTPDFDSASRPAVCLAMTISNVLVSGVLPGILSGAGCVIVAKAEAGLIAARVAEHRITTMSVPGPTLFDLGSRRDIRPEDLSPFVYPRTGGAELADTVRERYHDRFGRDVLGTYGLTEAPTLVAQEVRGEPHVPGSSGRILDYLTVVVADTTGLVLGPGEVGELCLGTRTTGPWAGTYRPFLGYWRRPRATRDAFFGSMVRTGDLGRLDASGNVFVTDRKRNMILRGGSNVYPAEVERTIRSHPGVIDCVVVGVHDPRLGERVAAAVEVPPGHQLTSEGMVDYCALSLARYKVPERIMFVHSLPRNSMSKPIRAEVKELFE